MQVYNYQLFSKHFGQYYFLNYKNNVCNINTKSFFCKFEIVFTRKNIIMASIFTKIINREIPANIIAEDENYIAFLDISPLTKGHSVVIPKKEVDYIFDLDDQTSTGLMLFAKKVAKAIDKSVDCKRVGVMVVGIEVPHAHIHLVPFNKASELNFQREKLKFTDVELQEIAKNIKSNIK